VPDCLSDSQVDARLCPGAVSLLLARHDEADGLERRRVVGRGAAQQHFERALRPFELIAPALQLLEPLHHRALAIFRQGVEPERLRPPAHVAAARELAHDHPQLVADQTRIHVLIALGQLRHRRRMEAALMGEGVAADVRGVGVEVHVRERGDRVRHLGELAQPLRGKHHVAELELQRRDQRDQIQVAAALAVAVDGALDVHTARIDGGERVGER
jgi:hypothetical protein